MPMRPCLDCRRPTEGRRCTACSRTKEQQRGSTTDRGYGAEHQRERAAWAPRVATGTVTCRRAPFGLCIADRQTIRPDEPWHLGHPDAACPAPKAPEHEACNVGAPNRGSSTT